MNRSIRALVVAGWAASLACGLALAGEAGAAVGKPKATPKAKAPKPTGPLAQKVAQARLKQQLAQAQTYQCMKFTRKNSAEDMVTGIVTHSRPTNPGGRQHVAYVFLIWGDLDNKIKGVASKYYSNWDGYVKVTSGKASVVREFAFDDGTPLLLSPKDKIIMMSKAKKALADQKKQLVAALSKFRDNAIALVRKLMRDPSKRREAERKITRRYHDALRAYDKMAKGRLDAMAKWGEPGVGSGVDELVKDNTKRQVTWEAGVVGATDGLLIRLDLPLGSTSGQIKAGKFTIPFRVTPLSADKQAKIDAAAVWKRTTPALRPGKPVRR